MPAFLLIGIPIVVAVLLWGILSLPDEEVKAEPSEEKKKSATKVKSKKKK